jgi:hypothetical protein
VHGPFSAAKAASGKMARMLEGRIVSGLYLN